MDFRLLPSPSNLLIFTLFLFHPLVPYAKAVSDDYSTLVYKTCAAQTFGDPLFDSDQGYSQTLDSLFAQLVAQSSQSSFFKTMEMGKEDRAISGLFQCRKDLSREECLKCVSLIAPVCKTSCGHSVAARVQLEGCYAQYEKEGGEWEGNDDRHLLHKVCGEGSSGDDEYRAYKEVMEGAFGALESGVQNSVNGFYRGSYEESVEMVAQCEGDMEGCECSECVSDAVQVAEQQCSATLSAQIYLRKCFISYIYHPQHHANSFPGANKNNNNSSNERLAAIAVGGAAAVCVGLIFLCFLKSRYRKGDFD